jgi:hypothetical protein
VSARYALYWCPDPASDLWRWACRWLGRDPLSGVEYAGDPARRPLVEEPQRYGFHATLKPPFRMRPDKDPAGFMAAVEAFAMAREPFVAPPLELAQLGGFLALPDPPELARRRARGLDPIEEANLRAWGYPYVLDRFRFHLTLTGHLADSRQVKAQLAADTAAFCKEPLKVDALAVFEQPAEGEPFRLTARFPFRG